MAEVSGRAAFGNRAQFDHLVRNGADRLLQNPTIVTEVAAVPPRILGLTDWRALARGGFATVWVARQESLNRLVAVKVDQRRLDSDTEQRRFLREAGAVGRMSGHPGIVTVHDAGILRDNRPYLVMELCEGGSLTKWVKAEKRPSAKQVQEVGVRIADALAATHARGVLHRDVKPANILIDSYGHAGLADFGLAALPDPGMELSETFEAITPAYAPPEVFDRKSPTEASDVFSLAATLYALLAGHPPRWPDNGMPTVADMLPRQDEPIERIPGVDDSLMNVLLSALAADPADRPTATQFRDRLSELHLEPPPPQARRAAPRVPARVGAESDEMSEPTSDPWQQQDRRSDQGSRRRRRGALVVAAVVLVAAAVAVSLVTLLPVGGRPVGGTTPGESLPVSPTSANATASSASPSATSPSATPKPQVPDSFIDCSEQLGSGAYCTPEPECWGSYNSYADAVAVSESADCDESHLYQTFAAGDLEFELVRQSKLDNWSRVKKVCTEKVVNRMLDEDDQRTDWEVYALGPQNPGETFYRCIFGRGERSAPIKLKRPY
jgi:serine/threonine protein kinase